MISKEDCIQKLAYPIQTKKVVFTTCLSTLLQEKLLVHLRLNLDDERSCVIIKLAKIQYHVRKEEEIN